jgi:hypothetical protein
LTTVAFDLRGAIRRLDQLRAVRNLCAGRPGASSTSTSKREV